MVSSELPYFMVCGNGHAMVRYPASAPYWGTSYNTLHYLPTCSRLPALPRASNSVWICHTLRA